MRRTVRDVMTRDVAVARASWSFKTVARHLRASGVSALPVVDEAERVVGIVSEGDLLLKEEGADAGRHHVAMVPARRRERCKAEASSVRELMSAPVFTVGPDDTIAIAARRMHEHGVKRLPVVEADGRLVGIVSRQDLMKIFLRSDDQIRSDVVEAIDRSMGLRPEAVRVDVAEGVVSLEGRLESKSMIEILINLVRGVDGVVDVAPRLSFEIDRLDVPPAIPWGMPRARFRS